MAFTAEEEPIELTGNMKRVLPGTMLQVALANGHEVRTRLTCRHT